MVAQHYFTIGPMYRASSDLSGDKRSLAWQSEQTVRAHIEPAMGCDAGPTLNRYWVGRPSLCVQGTSHRRVH